MKTDSTLCVVPRNQHAQHTALVKSLLLAISEKYKPACLMFRLNVIVAAASRGGGRGGVVRSAPNGSPDLIGCVGLPDGPSLPGGRSCAVAIEVKAGKDRLGPDQVAFRGAWLVAGGIYIEARDVERTMELLDLALRGPAVPPDCARRAATSAAEYNRLLDRKTQREAGMWGEAARRSLIDPEAAEI